MRQGKAPTKKLGHTKKERNMNMKEYRNEDGKCECWKCELKNKCPYKDRYQRLPRTTPGALGLCKKLNEVKK